MQVKTILVVEDESALLEVIKSNLEMHGFTVYAAETTEQARNLLKENGKPDAIWLDHYLPKENGTVLATEIKSDSEMESIPIFLISNTASRNKVEEYKEIGICKNYVKAEKRLDQIVQDIMSYFKTNA